MRDLRNVIKTPLTKNILTLVTGNTIALITPVFLYPILSRIFSIEDYAVYGLYISIFSLLEIASVGRYDLAIALPKDDEESINVIAGSLIISIFYSLFILLGVWIYKDAISRSLNNSALENWLLLMPLSIFSVSITKVFTNWLVRKKKFRATSINKTSQKLSEVVCQFCSGVSNFGNGLIIGDTMGRFFGSIFSTYQGLKHDFNKNKISLAKIKVNLQRFSDLPKYNILPSMFNALASMIPVFIISSSYSNEASGSFNFSRVILSIPFALISSGISQVLMQEISEKRNLAQSIAVSLLRLVINLLCLSILGIVVLFFFGPMIFKFVFGAEWELAGEFTKILIFSYSISFIISPFSIILIVLDRIKIASAWQVGYFALSSILWFCKDLKVYDFLIVLVIIDVCAYLLYAVLIAQTILSYEKKLLNNPQ